jgi:hypothetical protein
VAKITLQLARAAKHRAAELLADLPGLVGIGLTKSSDNGYALKVNLEAPPPRNRLSKLPKAIDGVPVAFEVVGRLRPR